MAVVPISLGSKSLLRLTGLLALAWLGLAWPGILKWDTNQYCIDYQLQYNLNMVCYTRSQLIELNSSMCHSCKLPTDVWSTVMELGLRSKPPTRRGTRAGKSVKTDIPSLPSCVACNSNTSSPRLHNDMSLGVWNAQSITSKTDILCENIIEHDFDIMIVTESWMKPDDDVKLGEMCPPGYNGLNCSRGSRGGGIAVVHKKQYKLLHCDDLLPASSSFEHALIRSNDVNLVIIYRSPSNSKGDFLSEFEEFLGTVDLLPGRSIVAGDFNIHVNKPWLPEVKSFLEVLTSANFHQVVRGPTHKSGNTLDLIIVRKEDITVEACTNYPLHVSDHYLIAATVDLPKLTAHKISYSFRNFRDMDIKLFSDDLSAKMDSIIASEYDDLDSLVYAYNTGCQDVLDSHAPITCRTRSVRSQPRWFNKSVQDARQYKRRCERRWRKSRSDTDRQAYISSQRKVADVIATEKKLYFKETLLNCNTKDMFKTVNTLLNKSQCSLPDCSDPVRLANSFGNFFVNKVDKIRKDVDKKHSTSAGYPEQICPPHLPEAQIHFHIPITCSASLASCG
ncbi:uncharacterized protein [Amphiura filiformis]|uniref:uncharacterized protein n=1 Tax=Amphiura filiformis TaxID=82378 RepID=UPI003B21A63C